MTLPDYVQVVGLAVLGGVAGSLLFSFVESLLVRRAVRSSMRGRR